MQEVCQHREPFFREVLRPSLSVLGKNPHSWVIIPRPHNELISNLQRAWTYLLARGLLFPGIGNGPFLIEDEGQCLPIGPQRFV